MKKYLKTNLFIAVFILSTILSCSTGPKPIKYGADSCHYCKMTIVDKIHAAELVTKKGKVYKFDAAECMVNHIKEIDKNTIDKLLTNHHDTPEELIPISTATFLISEQLPSPMGAYLTAFDDRPSAEEVWKNIGGTLYTWEELQNHLNN
ncbi:nitrous oxide reductase accessory protein NosL [Spongiivirga sp. MCCC 1A20706]|uniref:nitrous oxide reductase accessory protein NosL n=1 Tax=Spongiivirga sp. MCCC 1A20706 TaxID=3160963 RepID=UPI00397788E2